MVNVPKPCRNLLHSTFSMFIDHYEGNRVWKRISYWHAESWDCLLIHWLPMNSLLFLIETIWRSNSDTIISEKETFPQFFHGFLISILNFKYFERKYDPHRFCISDITASEKVVRSMPKKSRFRGSFHKQHGKRAKALFKSASVHFYPIDWSLKSQLSCKKSLLLTSQILGLLVNTLPADEKYPFLNRDNFTIPIQMLLSQKQKIFSQFFAAFLKFSWNFIYFGTIYDPHRFCISEITDSKNGVR